VIPVSTAAIRNDNKKEKFRLTRVAKTGKKARDGGTSQKTFQASEASLSLSPVSKFTQISARMDVNGKASVIPATKEDFLASSDARAMIEAETRIFATQKTLIILSQKVGLQNTKMT
jgi:hypothetical protein